MIPLFGLKLSLVEVFHQYINVKIIQFIFSINLFFNRQTNNNKTFNKLNICTFLTVLNDFTVES